MGQLSQEVNLIFLVSIFLLVIAVGIITLVLVYRRKQVEYIHEQNRLKAAFEKELLEAQLEIQEQTMNHLAQEIHDNIGGTLSLAKLHLNTIHPDRPPAAVAEKIGDTKELVSKAISDLRTLSKTLHRDAGLSVGLVRAIEVELQQIERSGVFKTELSISGTPQPLDPKKELILFRTVQEALNNAIKHAQANRLEVKLLYLPQTLVLTVADNGRGFDAEAVQAQPDRGSGLRHMHERTRIIGGALSIRDARPGTKIQIRLPIIAP